MRNKPVQIREEDIPAIRRVEQTLTANGLEIHSMGDYDHKSQRYYDFNIGEVLPAFKDIYEQIKKDIPRAYSLKRRYPDFSNIRHPQYYDYFPISEKRRDLSAKRIMLKQAIKSLETPIIQENEEFYDNSYYRVFLGNVNMEFLLD